ncbi:TPA: DNA oxidative demethylase AlkB, partial [Klebsiella pneumoniae]|nr:DNA oxidative demethylase AlkB [Klebsiella pneumoniae]
MVLRRFARERAPALLQAIADVASQSPFRQMV